LMGMDQRHMYHLKPKGWLTMLVTLPDHNQGELMLLQKIKGTKSLEGLALEISLNLHHTLEAEPSTTKV
jgi:hypothetical protein